LHITRRSFLQGLGAAALSLGWGRRALAQPSLRVSLPPLIDSLPLGYAHEEGLFAEAGLDVEFIGISSRRERNAALFSDGLDGVLSDISTFLFGRGNAGADIVMTSTAFEQVDDNRQLALLASGFFNVDDLENLLDRVNERSQNSIFVSQRTDFELVADELIGQLGIEVDPTILYADTDDLVTTATLLVAGSALAAVLPEPLASLTERNELIEEQFLARSISDFDQVQMPPSVMVFRRDVVEARAAEVERFYAVYNEAVKQLNEASQGEVREAAIANTIELFLPGLTRSELPANFGEDYAIPLFPQPGELSSESFGRVADWAQSKRYLNGEVTFEQSVDFRFLSL